MVRMLLWITAISLIVAFSCERLTQPRLGGGAFTLQEAATLVTESYLRLHAGQVVPGSTLRVYRNGEKLWQKPYTEADSIVYDSTLAPAHTYTYRAELWSGSRQLARSNAVTVTTLDTTSHDFEWEIIEFPSPYGSGALYDVAIINENDIWAVGEIYSDSTQPWLPYNGVHWDGEKWELKRIFVEYRGQPNLAPLEGIFALSGGQIIFTSGLPYLPDNGRWKLYHLWDMGVLRQNDGSVNCIWGTSIDNLYFAGRKGTIVHYDGSSWRRIESGTEERGNDVWGYVHPDGNYSVFFAFSDSYKPGRHVLLTLDNGNSLESLDWPDSVYIESIWTDSPRYLFACGSGVWQRGPLGWRKYQNLPNVFRERIRGSGVNNILVVGHYGQILHYNGKDWRVFQFNPEIGILMGLAMKGSLVYAVGVALNTHRVFIIKGIQQM